MYLLQRGLIYWLLAVIPFGYLAVAVTRYGFDFPWWDQWTLIPLLERSYQGTLSFSDLWGLHIGHRILFPRLVMLTLARLSRWNISCEIVSNVALGTGTFVIIVAQFMRTAKEVTKNTPYWIVPVFSLLMFSMTQWHNWAWGWGLCVFLNVFAVVAGVALLSSPSSTWWHYLGALLMGVVACCSFASGLAFWLTSLPILLLAPMRSRTVRVLRISLWIAFGALAISLYLLSYTPSKFQLSARSILSLDFPIQSMKWVLAFLGFPVVSHNLFGSYNEYGAYLAGGVGLVLCVLGNFALIRSKRATPAHLVPYISLSLYSIACAMMTFIGRSNIPFFGIPGAPRYSTLSTLFWVSNASLLCLLTSGHQAAHAHQENRWRATRYVAGLLAAILLFAAASSWRGSQTLARRHSLVAEARDELVSGTGTSLSRRLYWNRGLFPKYVQILKRRRLSIFRDYDLSVEGFAEDDGSY